MPIKKKFGRPSFAEELQAEYRSLVRQLDVAMHGEEGAAKQASLCDLIPLAKRMRKENADLRRALEHTMDHVVPDRACHECRAAAKLLGLT